MEFNTSNIIELYCLNIRSSHMPVYIDITTANLESKSVLSHCFRLKYTVNSFHCGIHLIISWFQFHHLFPSKKSPIPFTLNGISPSGCNNFRLTLGDRGWWSPWTWKIFPPCFCWDLLGSYLVTHIQKKKLIQTNSSKWHLMIYIVGRFMLEGLIISNHKNIL